VVQSEPGTTRAWLEENTGAKLRWADDEADADRPLQP